MSGWRPIRSAHEEINADGVPMTGFGAAGPTNGRLAPLKLRQINYPTRSLRPDAYAATQRVSLSTEKVTHWVTSVRRCASVESACDLERRPRDEEQASFFPASRKR